jgi:hypothetical protein
LIGRQALEVYIIIYYHTRTELRPSSKWLGRPAVVRRDVPE